MNIETIHEKYIKEFEHLVDKCKINNAIYKPADSIIQYNQLVILLKNAKISLKEFNKALEKYEASLRKRTCTFETFNIMSHSISLSIDKSKLKKEFKNKLLKYLSQTTNSFTPKNLNKNKEYQINFNKSSNVDSVFDQRIENIEIFINYFNSISPTLVKELITNRESILKILPILKNINIETKFASEYLVNSILKRNEILYNEQTGLKGIKAKVEEYLKTINYKNLKKSL